MAVRSQMGARGEQFAAEHFERLGYEVIARNHRTRFGELDLVVADRTALVFVEVKTRRSGGGSPWQSLHERKRERVRVMASSFLAEVADRPRRPVLRFDAVGVVLDGEGQLVALDHLEGAF